MVRCHSCITLHYYGILLLILLLIKGAAICLSLPSCHGLGLFKVLSSHTSLLCQNRYLLKLCYNLGITINGEKLDFKLKHGKSTVPDKLIKMVAKRVFPYWLSDQQVQGDGNAIPESQILSAVAADHWSYSLPRETHSPQPLEDMIYQVAVHCTLIY